MQLPYYNLADNNVKKGTPEQEAWTKLGRCWLKLSESIKTKPKKVNSPGPTLSFCPIAQATLRTDVDNHRAPRMQRHGVCHLVVRLL